MKSVQKRETFPEIQGGKVAKQIYIHNMGVQG